jgi:hypothetical protein
MVKLNLLPKPFKLSVQTIIKRKIIKGKFEKVPLKGYIDVNNKKETELDSQSKPHFFLKKLYLTIKKFR